MIERCEHLRFALEPGDAIGIGGERIGQDLDRDVASELRVARAIDLAHAARTERGHNLIRPERRPWRHHFACRYFYFRLASVLRAFSLNSRSSGVHSGSSGASITACSSVFASALRLLSRKSSARKKCDAVLVALYLSDARRCASDSLSLPPNIPGTLKYQRPSARSADPCMNAGSSRSTVSSASFTGFRYLIPCRRPNDSAIAPMLAATQKCPSGRSLWSAIARCPAAIPSS